MRFVTYNIRYDNPADGRDAWPSRRPAVSALLAGYRPDVFGLQEAQRHQVAQIQEDLARYHGLDYDVYGVGRDDGREAGEQCPIFHRRGVVERGATGTFWLSETPEVPGTRFPGSDFPRLTSWCELRSGGRTFYFFCAHFDYREDTQVQPRSAELVLQRVPAIAGLYPSVFVADLNSTPERGIRARLTSSFFVDSQVAAASLPADRNVNPGAGTFTEFRDASRAADPGGSVIDYVLLSGFQVERREVSLGVRADTGRCVSDHRPIIVDASICV